MNKKRKKWVIIGSIIIVVAVVLAIIFSSGKPKTGGGGGESIQTVPLSQEQINILSQNVLSSEFIEDLPAKGIVGLMFYSFENGERIWHSGFLIGREGFLSSGTPDFILIMDAKYIEQLNEKDLCEVVQSADAEGAMWVESELSDAKLFLKYAGMMKYRDCFGF